MITAKSEEAKYRTILIGKEIFADISESGLRNNNVVKPYEFLEAALASCMNITLRMSMEKHGLPSDGLEIDVKLNKEDPDKTIFEYSYRLNNQMDDKEKAKILRVLEQCPVKKMLTKELEFKFIGD